VQQCRDGERQYHWCRGVHGCVPLGCVRFSVLLSCLNSYGNFSTTLTT
jgi:hypothetical protein